VWALGLEGATMDLSVRGSLKQYEVLALTQEIRQAS
jgi:hypothetical protein